jgi:putative toxin-antitoxin system antitoxin component (TIGR02293 family)
VPEPEWELRDTAVEYVLDQVRSGLPASAVTRVHTTLGLKQAEFLRLAGIKPRTLMRRRSGDERRLTAAESAPVMRYALLFRRATEVLGSAVQASVWLKAPRPALGGCTPLEYASTEFGARAVDELLGRLQQGVFS